MEDGDKVILGIIAFIMFGFLGFSVLIGIVDGDSFDEAGYKPINSGPIPDLGVNKVQATEFEKASARIRMKKSKKMMQSKGKDYLTSEELEQNIEDAEMKGMGDDPATLEDLRDELK